MALPKYKRPKVTLADYAVAYASIEKASEVAHKYLKAGYEVWGSPVFSMNGDKPSHMWAQVFVLKEEEKND